MMSLNCRIPPPLVALLCATAAWLLARSVPGCTGAWSLRIPVAFGLVAGGFLLALSGALAVRRAGTTLNPHTPEGTTSIVRSGPFRMTRNPMYLGLATLLLGLCAYLANPLTLLVLPLFVAYITRFQIIPEERALLARFGEPYAQYLRSVRRWL
ncbi:MAG: isoprenylcysteine carboxylmethyltransferase family protein [Gammaproteobacteria bacterium]|nr:isoprenylcysteine carboxylmethyltransferase family protein [Gammaproteobacteria bacterium]